MYNNWSFYCHVWQRSAEGSSAEDGEGKQNTIISVLCHRFSLKLTIKMFYSCFQIQIKMREAIAPL